MGSVLDRDSMEPHTRKAHSWVSGVFAAIFFIVVVAYAAWRGGFTHNKNPTLLSNFQARTSVPFPVFTFCPLVPITLVGTECELEKDDNAIGSCLNTMTASSIMIENKLHNCLSFNVQGTLNSNQTVDEIGIQIFINKTQLPLDDPISGAFVILHTPGTTPEIEAESTFVADVGELTEVFLRLEQTTFLDGSVELDYLSSASGAANQDPTMANTIDIDFWFNPQGMYVNQQFLNYTVDNWIGEVGGFACLLSFLHYFLVWVIIAIYRRSKEVQKKKLKKKKKN